jgi:calpain-15
MKSVIIAKNHSNCLDDLKQLLKNSKKFQDAQMVSRLGPFSDKEFLPNIKSLIGFQVPRNMSFLQSLKWFRPDIFFKNKPIAVYNKIEPDDIHQGALGDCYFLAACSSIAQKSQRLERLFLCNGNYNKDGLYAVAICVNGIWQEIILDDLIPCTLRDKKPAFNTSKEGELWVMLLEKAWAKIHNGYMNISAGLTREALRDLTGASAKTFFTEKSGPKKEKQWGILCDAFLKDHIMCAGSDDLSAGSDAYIEKIGICGSHAYSLLGVHEVLNGRKVKLGTHKNNSKDFIYKKSN